MRDRGRGSIGAWMAGLLLSVGSVLLLPSVVLGGDPQSPVDVIRERNTAVESILESAGEQVSGEAREQLKDIINGLMDFRELSRRALGKHWDERTEEENAEFVSVVRQLIRNSSVQTLSIYKADSVTYLEPEIRGERADVTTVAHKGRKTAEIVYRMHKVDGEWKAYDLVIDGSSTSRTYRDSFYKQIAKTSYGEMYDKLVERLKKDLKKDTQSP